MDKFKGKRILVTGGCQGRETLHFNVKIIIKINPLVGININIFLILIIRYRQRNSNRTMETRGKCRCPIESTRKPAQTGE